MTERDLLKLIGETPEQDVMTAMQTRSVCKEKGAQAMKEINGNKPGKYAKRRHFKGRMLIAAVIAAAALAGGAIATHYSHSLMDDLRAHTLQDPEGYEELLVTAPTEEVQKTADSVSAAPELAPLASGKDEMAEYQVLEAILDSESLYLHERIVPLDDSVIFIDQLVEPDSPVEMLENPELSGMTVKEYADSQGKTLRYARLVEHFEGDIINGWGYHAMTASDGSLHVYGSGSNPSGSKTLSLSLEGFTYGPTDKGPFLERSKFNLSLEDKSSATERVFRTFKPWKEGSPDLEKDLGLVMKSLSFKETELGIYATFTYERNDVYLTKAEAYREELAKELPELADLDLSEVYLYYFYVEDENGESFKITGPGGGSGGVVEDGGVYTYTESVPKVEDVSRLKFKIVSGQDGSEGIYSFSE